MDSFPREREIQFQANCLASSPKIVSESDSQELGETTSPTQTFPILRGHDSMPTRKRDLPNLNIDFGSFAKAIKPAVTFFILVDVTRNCIG